MSARVFWDTNLFIYLLEGRSPTVDHVSDLLERMRARGDELYTSAMTLGEVLALPLSAGHDSLAKAYEQRICADAVIVPFDRSAARYYAEIRRDRTIKAPDAIQLACAGVAETELFITNDRRLTGKVVRGVRFIVGIDNLPL